jgi:hypothetical protein
MTAVERKHGADSQASHPQLGTAADFSKEFGAPAEQTAYLEARTHCAKPGCSGTGLKKCGLPRHLLLWQGVPGGALAGAQGRVQAGGDVGQGEVRPTLQTRRMECSNARLNSGLLGSLGGGSRSRVMVAVQVRFLTLLTLLVLLLLTTLPLVMHSLTVLILLTLPFLRCILTTL